MLWIHLVYDIIKYEIETRVPEVGMKLLAYHRNDTLPSASSSQLLLYDT